MSISFIHSKGADAPIAIPAIGLDLIVHMSLSASGGAFSIIETLNAPGKGPPRHKHTEAEIFRVLEGRYLYEMNGRRFYAEAGDVISIPGSAEHGFVNVTDKPARQYILIVPGLDASAFFTELADVMRNGAPDKSALIDSAPSGEWNSSGRRLALPISRPCEPLTVQALMRRDTSETAAKSAAGAVAAT